MTVFENVALPLVSGLGKIPRNQVAERVRSALAQVGMEQMFDRPAPQLSGGQQQRVALARSLALQPRILLMDEPLSNLDARLREEVRAEIRDLVNSIGVTVLYVTHDQDEAMDLADRIVVLHQGQILQVGTAEELYIRPQRQEVAQFLGSMNWIKGTLIAQGRVRTGLGDISLDCADHDIGKTLTLGVRPEFVHLLPLPDKADPAAAEGNVIVPGHVVDVTFYGDHHLYRVKAGELTLKAHKSLSPVMAGHIQLSIPVNRICIFPSAMGHPRPA